MDQVFPMQSSTPLSTAQLATCVRIEQQEVARLKAECVQCGALLIDRETVERLHNEIKAQRSAIVSMRRRVWLARFQLLWIKLRQTFDAIRAAVHRMTAASELPWFIVGLFGGTTFLLVLLATAAIIGLSSTLAICAGIIAFALGFWAVVPHFSSLSESRVMEDSVAACDEIQIRLRSLADHRHLLERLHADLQRIRPLLPLRQKYDQERLRLDTFARELNDRRHNLLLQDWRAMRGVPFESFLGEVLQSLGFEIETTKISRDQGIDLIASRAGERLGVQVKGYDGSVSNAAVQQAFAGMSHYRCHRCAVITNSNFTSAARELALSTGCILVDQTLIPDLIAGKVFSSLISESPVTQEA